MALIYPETKVIITYLLPETISGNGIEAISGGSLSPTPEYTGLNLLVPGTGGGASHLKMSMFLVFLCIIVALS